MKSRFYNRIREKGLDVNQAPIMIVAFGDSVTQGVMEHLMLDSQSVYHRQVQELLEGFFPTTTFSTINAGVSGDKAALAVQRIDRDIIRHDPDLVLVAFGLNDSLDGDAGLPAFDAAIRKIVEETRNRSKAEILLLTPPFMAKRESYRVHPDHAHMGEAIRRAQNEGFLAKYASAVRQIAADNHCMLADVYKEWQRMNETNLDSDVLLINGFNHPNAYGHRFTATLVWHALLNLYFQSKE